MKSGLRIPSRLPHDTEELIHDVIGCCIAVHRALGPGLSEKVYVRALSLELLAHGIGVEHERRIEVVYRDQVVGTLRIDLIAGGQIVIEAKAVEQLALVHHRQTVNYMRLTGLRAGLLVNFNVAVLRDGLSRKAL